MTFKRFVCWDPKRVAEVMDPEALQTPPYVFLATHHPIRMYLQDLVAADSRREYSEERFLSDFLGTKDYAFVPVLGESGTGKSHLIRWLAANIDTSSDRRVLLIPRAGTNLRDIIGRILDVMEGPLAADLRTRLDEATSNLSVEEARGHLLSNLATLVEHGGAASMTDEERYIRSQLPALLLDWHFRQRLLEKGRIIDQLITHILGKTETIEAIEERRKFSAWDLHLDIDQLHLAGAVARDFYLFQDANPDIQEATVNILNSHLDEAIARMLKLNREDLERLMHEVRITLADQGTELVLLIEDFAKLQGIDRQVLAAVLERPEEEGRSERYCALRTALACTPGYFDSLIGTVKTRTTFSVTLDVGAIGDDSLVTESDMVSFVSRYLNAARVPIEDLKGWYESRGEDEGGGGVPLRCDRCEYRDSCHPSFKESGGIGLYPFTPKALQRMIERVTKGGFNPRLIIKEIIKHTLEAYADDLAEGRFPSPALHAHFGGSTIGAHLRSQIISSDPAHRERREVLLDLWADGNQLIDLDERIHEAFDLPRVGAQVIAEPPVPQPEPTPQPGPGGDTLPPRLSELIKNLDAWANGTEMTQNVAGALRPLIFSALSERIEWTSEGLMWNRFISAEAKIFLQKFVNFRNASTFNNPTKGVGLQLPLEETQLNETALALQALLKYHEFGNWNYAGGAQDFRIYARQLEAWASSVVTQIRHRPRLSGEYWDPVPAVTELLALGVRVAGRPSAADYTTTDIIDALFGSLDNVEVSGRASKWRELFDALKAQRGKLSTVLRTYVSCAKGDASDSQVIDVVQITDVLKTLRKSWTPQQDVPGDLRDDLAFIKTLRDRVDSLLAEAVREEKEQQVSWRRNTISQLGEEAPAAKAADVIKDVSAAVQASGDYPWQTSEELDAAIDRFERSQLDRCLTAIQRVESEDNPAKLFEELSRIPQATIVITNEFLSLSDKFLRDAEKRLKSQIEGFRGSGGDELERLQDGIRDALAQLSDLVTEVQGGEL